MLAASQRRLSVRNAILSIALIGAALGATLALTARAQAAELLYWNNYGPMPPGQSIAFANSDGTGGGALNLTGVNLVGPEGMAIDTVTGRLFVASNEGGADKKGQILAVNLDGSGAAVFAAPGAPVESPYGIALDPVTRTIYWGNDPSGLGNGSLAWAKLDGSAGGVLNTAGASFADPYKLALDPVSGRLYFGSHPGGKLTFAYVNVNNSGGADLAVTPAPTDAFGFAVDPAGGRLYWSTEFEINFTGLNGGAATKLDTAPALFAQSYGFAVDPTLNKVTWPNYDNNQNRVNGLGFASLSGGSGGNITPVSAPFDGPQDVLVLKSPTATAAPGVARAKNDRSQLTCSTGTWAADFAGSYVYQAPTTTAYQWLRNGKAIADAMTTMFTAKSPGKYVCQVTGANQAGSTAITSNVTKVQASKAKLTTRKKVAVKAGATATFRVKVANQGDLKPKKATKLCVQLPKSAKGSLVAPKCKSLGKLKGKGKKSATVKIKTTASASGTYTVTFKAKGLSGKPLKAKVVVR